MKDYSNQTATERQPTQIDLLIKSASAQNESLSETLELLAEKITRLDRVCSKIQSDAYPKNFPQKEVDSQKSPSVCKPQRGGLLGEFDSVFDRKDALIKQLLNELIPSLNVSVEFLEQNV